MSITIDHEPNDQPSNDEGSKKLPPVRGRAGPGRPPGTANKTTTTLRSLLTMLADHNIGHVQNALDQVREGVKGQVFIPGLGMHEGWISKPDPGKFVDLYVKLIEFAAPKLQRQEVVDHRTPEQSEPISTQATPEEARQAYEKLVGAA